MEALTLPATWSDSANEFSLLVFPALSLPEKAHRTCLQLERPCTLGLAHLRLSGVPHTGG